MKQRRMLELVYMREWGYDLVIPHEAVEGLE